MKRQMIEDLEDRLIFQLLEARRFRRNHRGDTPAQKAYIHQLCDQVELLAVQYYNATGVVYRLKREHHHLDEYHPRPY